MREIKFRAWDSKNGMIDVKTLGFDEKGILKSQKIQQKIMQFTGLTDKNGVEIYEGDVVRWVSENVEIIFSNGSFGFDYNDGFTLLSSFTNTAQQYIEVIGNIYEDKHLLNQDD